METEEDNKWHIGKPPGGSNMCIGENISVVPVLKGLEAFAEHVTYYFNIGVANNPHLKALQC